LWLLLSRNLKAQTTACLVVGFDVQHGNCTEDIFVQYAKGAQQAQVLFCSTYQHPYYPGFAGE